MNGMLNQGTLLVDFELPWPREMVCDENKGMIAKDARRYDAREQIKKNDTTE